MKSSNLTWYQISVFCGLMPLLLGSAVSLLYWLTRSERIVWMGFLTFSLGVFLVCCGVLALALAHCKRQRPTALATLLAVGLLGLNGPFAYVGTALPAIAKTTYVLEIVNGTGETIDSLMFTGVGLSFHLGDLPPGDSRLCVFRPESEGSLTYLVKVGGREEDGSLDSELLLGETRRILLRILPGGAGQSTMTPHQWSFPEAFRLLRALGFSRGTTAFWDG